MAGACIVLGSILSASWRRDNASEHCLDAGGTAGLIGFIEHCLGQSPPQFDVVMDLWRELRHDYDQLSASEGVEPAPRRVLLEDILRHLMSHLKQALARQKGRASP